MNKKQFDERYYDKKREEAFENILKVSQKQNKLTEECLNDNLNMINIIVVLTGIIVFLLIYIKVSGGFCL